MKGDERKFGELVAPILIGGQAPAGEADIKLQDILEFDHAVLPLGGDPEYTPLSC